jgi:GNAT superfamily N-acetyltransferase
MRIESYAGSDIVDSGILQTLLSRGIFHGSRSPGGLFWVYNTALKEGRLVASYLWVVYTDDNRIAGVGVITHTALTCVQLYVCIAHRRKGYGKALLKKAIDTGIKFSGAHTPQAKQLYTKFKIPDNLPEYVALIKQRQLETAAE